MDLSEVRKLTCENCGGAIDWASMKCPYCGTQYERKHDGITLNYVVNRPGVHTFRAECRVDRCMVANDPERATRYALDKLRHEMADGLLAYMKIATSKDFLDNSEIIRGEIRVIDPEFTY